MTLGRVLCDRAFFAMGRALDVWNEKAPSKWPHKMSKTAPLFFAASPSPLSPSLGPWNGRVGPSKPYRENPRQFVGVDLNLDM